MNHTKKRVFTDDTHVSTEDAAKLVKVNNKTKHAPAHSSLFIKSFLTLGVFACIHGCLITGSESQKLVSVLAGPVKARKHDIRVIPTTLKINVENNEMRMAFI